jgi:tetratricopeptide (TPR) repeat protein
MKMKNRSSNNIFLIIASLAVVLACSSCDELFDVKSGTRISPDDHFRAYSDVELSLLGAITPLTVAMPNLVLMDGLFTDMMDVTENSDPFMQELNNHVVSPSNPYIDPSTFYQVIINLNEILANVDRAQLKDPSIDDFGMKQIKGAIIGLRTWVYFTISKIYGEAVWIEDNLTELPANTPAFINKTDLIDTLINQLKPYLHLDEDIEEIRISIYPNNKALIGELYLEKNQYDSAAYYLKLAVESFDVDNAMYKVDGSYQGESWRYIFYGSFSNYDPEVISYIPFQVTEGQINPVYDWSFLQYAIKPSQSIVNLFTAQVPSKGTDDFRGMGVSIDTLKDGSPIIRKYILGDEEKNVSNIIISRAGDIHLLLAEALNRLGDSDLALKLMNLGISSMSTAPRDYKEWTDNIGIRGRAYVKERFVPTKIAADPNQKMLYVEDLIIEERALELAFEGRRWFDLVRIANRRGDDNYIASKVAPKFTDSSKAESVSNILKNRNNWYLTHPR